MRVRHLPSCTPCSTGAERKRAGVVCWPVPLCLWPRAPRPLALCLPTTDWHRRAPHPCPVRLPFCPEPSCTPAGVAGLLPLLAPPRTPGWPARTGLQSRGQPVAVAALALLPPLSRVWVAPGGRMAACSQTGTRDVLLRDLAVGTTRTLRWEAPAGAPGLKTPFLYRQGMFIMVCWATSTEAPQQPPTHRALCCGTQAACQRMCLLCGALAAGVVTSRAII